MIATITAFESSPDRGKGLARDMRVRKAIEDAGQAYDVRLLSFAAMKEPAHLDVFRKSQSGCRRGCRSGCDV